MNPPQCQARDFCISSDLAAAQQLQCEIEAALAAAAYGERDVFAVKLAFEEAVVNAIKHGNRLDPAKKVHVRYSISPERIDICIVDEGPGFDPEEVPDPTAPENLERPCGRGLLLMRHYMTEVHYTERGRCVQMCKVKMREC